MKKKITELKAYSKNPRRITDDKFKLLGESLETYGDLGGIVVNRLSGEVIGGNQRSKFFKEHSEDCEIEIVSAFKEPDAQGTVSLGYVVYKGQKYSYREVEWDEEKEKRANILANKATGFFDNDILLKDFDMELLLDTGFENFELSFFKEKERPVIDIDNFNDQLDTYLENEVKQVTIYMDSAKYASILDLLAKLQKATGHDNNTDVIIEAIEHYASQKIK